MNTKQAADLLDRAKTVVIAYGDRFGQGGNYVGPIDMEIEDLRAALATLEVEPAYWQWRQKNQPWTADLIFGHQVYATTDHSEVRALYASPLLQAAEPAGLPAPLVEQMTRKESP